MSARGFLPRECYQAARNFGRLMAHGYGNDEELEAVVRSIIEIYEPPHRGDVTGWLMWHAQQEREREEMRIDLSVYRIERDGWKALERAFHDEALRRVVENANKDDFSDRQILSKRQVNAIWKALYDRHARWQRKQQR